MATQTDQSEYSRWLWERYGNYSVTISYPRPGDTPQLEHREGTRNMTLCGKSGQLN